MEILLIIVFFVFLYLSFVLSFAACVTWSLSLSLRYLMGIWLLGIKLVHGVCVLDDPSAGPYFCSKLIKYR
jgi:hypothetical protein